MSGRCIIGDGLTVLSTLEAGSARCCVTSPPYWGLRDYQIAGQFGLESTPDEYVAKLVEVFREVKRVLRDDGTLWLNLGDSYSGSGKGGNPDDSPHVKQRTNVGSLSVRGIKRNGLKPKDLVGIPWRVAFALQEDGWYLRSCITWCKRAPMPESVQDRPTSATEQIFLLSKSERYYYNAEAVRETSIEPNWESRLQRASDKSKPTDKVNGIRQRTDKQRGHSRRHAGFNDRWDAMKKTEQMSGCRNMRNWWLLGPEPYPGAHFATFPSEIPERCILAASKPGDVVLDPFFGSGTTGQVAELLGRKWLGIEINPEYEKLSRERTAQQGITFHEKETR